MKKGYGSGRFISGREDMRWLKDVHLPRLSVKKFKSAMLYGNEDCPTKVEVYRSENPGMKANKVVFKSKGRSCRLKRR